MSFSAVLIFSLSVTLLGLKISVIDSKALDDFDDHFEIGEFDIGAFVSSSSASQQTRLSAIIDTSFQSDGIIKLTNCSLFLLNGRHRAITERLYAESKAFFEERAFSEKMRYSYGPPGTPGYLPANSEGTSSRTRNLKESFVFYSVPNDSRRIEPFGEPPVLFDAMQLFWRAMENDVIRHFHRAVQLSLAQRLSVANANANATSMAMELVDFNQNHKHLLIPYYYGTTIESAHKSETESETESEFEAETETEVEVQLRHQAHSDGFGFTYLWTDNHCGLQFYQNASERWIDVAPDPQSIFVISGQLIPYYTHHRWKSLWHRVIKCKDVQGPDARNNNSDAKTDAEADTMSARIAFVLFTGPDFDEIIFPWWNSHSNNSSPTKGKSVRKHLEHYWSNIDQYTKEVELACTNTNSTNNCSTINIL